MGNSKFMAFYQAQAVPYHAHLTAAASFPPACQFGGGPSPGMMQVQGFPQSDGALGGLQSSAVTLGRMNKGFEVDREYATMNTSTSHSCYPFSGFFNGNFAIKKGFCSAEIQYFLIFFNGNKGKTNKRCLRLRISRRGASEQHQFSLIFQCRS